MKYKIETVNPMTNRDAYWQYVRGICIICVVLIHCKNGIKYENIVTDSWNFDYWLVMRQFINFPVAVFVFLAGYFTNIDAAQKLNTSYISKRGGEATNTFLGMVYLLHSD